MTDGHTGRLEATLDDKHRIERFLSEIKTTAHLQHPHILAPFDSGEADGYLYYVMPYIDGETLAERLRRERQLGVDGTGCRSSSSFKPAAPMSSPSSPASTWS